MRLRGLRPLASVALGVITVVTAALLIFRAVAYSDSLRMCSHDFSLEVHFSDRSVVFDDGVMADQYFPMRQCSTTIDIRDCFRSIFTFVNPLQVGSGESLSYIVRRSRSGSGMLVDVLGSDVEDGGIVISMYLTDSGQLEVLWLRMQDGLARFDRCPFRLLSL